MSRCERHIEACPACVAFLRDLRVAIDRCRSLEVPCDPAVAPRLRSILTQEYLRLLNIPTEEKIAALCNDLYLSCLSSNER